MEQLFAHQVIGMAWKEMSFLAWQSIAKNVHRAMKHVVCRCVLVSVTEV